MKAPEKKPIIEPSKDVPDVRSADFGDPPLFQMRGPTRRATFESVLSRVNDWYGKALRKLAE